MARQASLDASGLEGGQLEERRLPTALPTPWRAPRGPAVHPAAHVDPAAILGDGVEVGPGACIGPDVRLERGVRVGPNAVLTGMLQVGADVRIFAGAVIGEEPQDLKFRGEPSSLRIGARTTICEHVTIHRGCGEGAETVIGADVLLMANCHVAHDCRIGDRSIICNGALLAGHVELFPSVMISGNAVVHQFVRIGRLAMIGGGSRVSRDVPSFGLLVGDSELRGINGVGLRRAGVQRGAQEELRKAYSQLFRSTSNMREALSLLELTLKTPEGRELLAFLSATSRRGFCSMERKRRDLEETA